MVIDFRMHTVSQSLALLPYQPLPETQLPLQKPFYHSSKLAFLGNKEYMTREPHGNVPNVIYLHCCKMCFLSHEWLEGIMC